jgi:phosphoglycerate kinase
MSVSPEALRAWCLALLDPDPALRQLSLRDYLDSIPKLDSLADVPSGTPVLVRGDVDAKPGAAVGEGDIRLRSMVETLEYGRQRGWKQVIFGHVGREPEKSLDKVAARIGQLLDCSVPLVPDWFNPQTNRVTDNAAAAVRDARPGDVLVLENTRRYDIERVLWNARPDDLAGLVESLATAANDVAEKIARIYVNEALSAGSLDTSTLVVPAAMARVALGRYVAAEFEGPMLECLDAELVVFSGLKADKLNDLEAIIERGKVRSIISGGSLAMALKKAAAQLHGSDFCIGVAENPTYSDKPFYIKPERIEQARRMIDQGGKAGIQFVLPVDFVLQDGRVSETIGPEDQQFDVGPKTSEYYEQQIGRFLDGVRGRPAVAFHNGVLGMFEDPRYEEGTRRFIPQLKRMADAGVRVFVGGGEGGTALEKYGREDWVTHVFTAGGTVLNALGSDPVPYLVALRMAAGRKA